MKKRTQIENRLRSLGCILDQGYNRGQRVWYAGCAIHRPGVHKHTLTSGIACHDYWRTLDEAHDALFKHENIRADNYND